MSKSFDPYEEKLKQVNRTVKGFAKSEERRQNQKISKKVKRNRDARPPRQKDWMAATGDDDLPTRERIMPHGETARRKAVVAAAAKNIEDFDEPSVLEVEVGLTGTVIEIGTGICRVRSGERELLCVLRGALTAQETAYTNVIAIGDEVIVTDDGLGGGAVEAVLPRRSALVRLDPFKTHLRQVIAANVDQLLIIAAWREPHLWPELVDRYLIAAERNNLDPILCVNKIDLAEDRVACREMLQPYFAIGLRVLFTSARTGEGIDELRDLLLGRSTVLAGLSGVGKSSLISAVQPDLDLRIHEVSDHSRQGQHTTTQATLHALDGDGFVVDTPGIREFGLNGLRRADLLRFYPELLAVSDKCHFRNCAHINEPDCAVRWCVENGTLPALRYENYRKIYESIGA